VADLRGRVLARRRPLRVNQNGIFLLGPTLMEYGTEEQKKRFLPKMADRRGDLGQGWSEPGAGSDMAAIRARPTAMATTT
jgi:alkylation response protein AidB-like acyl-CoA dehydrogenase